MISLTKFIIILMIVLILAILIVSGKARAIGKAFLNLFIEDMAATPEGAEALYRQKEEEVEDMFRKADGVFKKIAGQLSRNEEELKSLQNELPKIEKACEKLAKNNDIEGLEIKAQERQDVIEDIENHKSVIQELSQAKEAAFRSRKACEDDLAEIKKRHKKTVSDMKRNAQMKEVYDDLEGIGANNHTSKLLERVEEKSRDLDDMVEGSRQAYESRTSTKSKRLNERLKKSDADDYAQNLLRKYQTPLLEDRNGNPALSAYKEELEKRRSKVK